MVVRYLMSLSFAGNDKFFSILFSLWRICKNKSDELTGSYRSGGAHIFIAAHTRSSSRENARHPVQVERRSFAAGRAVSSTIHEDVDVRRYFSLI